MAAITPVPTIPKPLIWVATWRPDLQAAEK
jgi:hypothetical protein